MGVKKPRCFFDISIGTVPVGRVVMQLFADSAPKTCENFRALCTGEMGIGKITGKPLHYQVSQYFSGGGEVRIQQYVLLSGNNIPSSGEKLHGPVRRLLQWEW